VHTSIDSRRLATFRAVVEAGQITLAARRLHLSQPAVTAQVQQLEAAVGKALLERRARGVVPTEAGRRMLAWAVQVEEVLERAQADVAERAVAGGPLVLAASSTTAGYVLPPLLAAFSRAEGGTSMRVEVGNTAEVLGWVEEGKVPLGLVEGIGRAPRVKLAPFRADELVPFVAADAPRELASVRRPEDLLQVPIAWREPGSGTRQVIERALRRRIGRRRAHPRDLQLGSTEAIKGVVRAGLALGFLSLVSVREELERGALRRLDVRGLRIERRFSWVLPGRELSGAAARFHAFANRESA